jgi:hypothetical protein
MMTKYIVESVREASIYGFKTGDFSEADRLAAANLEAVREMVRDLLTRAVDYIRLEAVPADPSRPYNVRLLTRSVRRSGAVQMTSICVYPSGLEVPNYHKSVCMDQPREARDFCQEMTAGTYTGAVL